MSILPLTNRGGPSRALVVCDVCGSEEIVACRRDRTGKASQQIVPNRGQVIKRVTGLGWVEIKGRLHCALCTVERRSQSNDVKEEASMGASETTVNSAPVSPAPDRTPDRDQKRLILLALEEAYDVPNQRYRGQVTDATIAADLGDGIMPGWVSGLRDEFYGPAGNEEVEAIRAELDKFHVRLDDMLKDFIGRQDAIRSDIDQIIGRLNRAVAAHDKRVRA